MKNKFSLLLLLAVAAIACEQKKNSHGSHEHSAQELQPADTIRKSIPKEVHAIIGNAHVTIKYHAPAVRGRVIWGGLVPFDQVWVTGAHQATSFESNKDFSVNGTVIPAGKYAIFTIPGQQEWTLIFNKNWDQHLTDEYDENEDVVRVKITPETTEALQERLRYYFIPQNDREAVLAIRWEKKRIAVPVTFNK